MIRKRRHHIAVNVSESEKRAEQEYMLVMLHDNATIAFTIT